MADQDDAVAALRSRIQRLKAGGSDVMSIEAIETWLQALPSGDANKTRLEEWKTLAQFEHAGKLEMFRSVIESGQTALKTLVTINGGAAAALLAFLSNLVSQQPNPILQAHIGKAMLIFVLGIAFGGAATASRYLTQWLGGGGWLKTGKAFNLLAIAFGLGSLSAFCMGGWLSYEALR